MSIRVADLSGNRAVAVAGGATITTGGVVFSSESQGVVTPGASSLGSNGDMCLEWGGVVSPPSTSGNIFYGYAVNSSGIIAKYYASVGVNKKITAGISGIYPFIPAQIVADGLPHHICIDRSGSDVRLFIDGVLSEQAISNLSTQDATPLADHGGEVCIGHSSQDQDGFVGSISYFRTTLASRHTSNYTPEFPVAGAADPLWSSTTYLMGIEGVAPTETVTISSMTGDTGTPGDWTTWNGDAGRSVYGTVSSALLAGEVVQISTDGGDSFQAAVTIGSSWSAVDIHPHASSWEIVARVFDTVSGLPGAQTVRAITLVDEPAPRKNPYADLITSEHATRPNFMASIRAITDPLLDVQDVAKSLSGVFDMDSATGAQLDDVGRWVGQSRYLTTPIASAWFSFDVSGLGFDEGTWKGPYDSTTGITALDDEPYRLLIKSKIAANHWDGTVQGAAEAWAVMFSGSGVNVGIQDNGDMTMEVNVYTSHALDAITTAIITGGYLGIKPAGVTITAYNIIHI